MAEGTKIEWAHHTVNFWWGCAFAVLATGQIREECRHCYAHTMAKVFSRGRATWGPFGSRWIRHEAARRELYRLDEKARAAGCRKRVFINSMSDTFEDRDILNEARQFLWDACSWVTSLDILLLTKRPENVLRMVPMAWLKNWPAHVWIGTTAGTQAAADVAVPALLKIPAFVRFLSCEPLLGSVELSFGNPKWRTAESYHAEIHWVICGGESGPQARPMHPDWARSLRDQCAAVSVPFLFKQWGEWSPRELVEDTRQDSTLKFFPNLEMTFARVGKHGAGRLLDGREHNEFPEVRS